MQGILQGEHRSLSPAPHARPPLPLALLTCGKKGLDHLAVARARRKVERRHALAVGRVDLDPHLEESARP